MKSLLWLILFLASSTSWAWPPLTNTPTNTLTPFNSAPSSATPTPIIINPTRTATPLAVSVPGGVYLASPPPTSTPTITQTPTQTTTTLPSATATVTSTPTSTATPNFDAGNSKSFYFSFVNGMASGQAISITSNQIGFTPRLWGLQASYSQPMTGIFSLIGFSSVAYNASVAAGTFSSAGGNSIPMTLGTGSFPNAAPNSCNSYGTGAVNSNCPQDDYIVQVGQAVSQLATVTVTPVTTVQVWFKR